MFRSSALMSQFVEAIPIPRIVETDLVLVNRAVAGDREAFSTLIERHYDLIFRTACKWCGRRSEAEDIAQEVCIKLASVLKSFDGRAAFTSWLYRVTLNAVRDMQRSQKRRGRQITQLAEVSLSEQPPDQEDAATSRQLWAAVQRLPDKQREAVMLVYAEELNHAAAAEIMGCKEATVSWHVHEAKKTLRGLL